MKKKNLGMMISVAVMLIGVIVLIATGGSKAELCEYEISLPESYDEENRNYPVVYVLPQDGYAIDDSGIAEMLQEHLEMIIVRPQFEKDSNLFDVMEVLMDEIDDSYRTIEDRMYRGLVGTGTGGYLAYRLGLEGGESSPFGAVASIRGDFVSSANPWYEVCGDVNEMLQDMQAQNSGVFDSFYTYMDAPVNDAWTNDEGSTNDLGSKFISFGTASAYHEFTVRPGAFTDEFLDESVSRVADRFAGYMYAGLVEGTVTLENASLAEDVAKANVNYSLNITEQMDGFKAKDVKAEVTVSVVDSETGEVLAQNHAEQEIEGAGEYAGQMEVDNLVNGSASNVTLSVKLFGSEMELADAKLSRSNGVVIEGDYQKIDLAGDWYFFYQGNGVTLKAKDLMDSKEYESWSIVQPGFGNWKKGFGNINDETVKSNYGDDYFDYMILGNAYYVKEFYVPEEFDSTDLLLSIGYVDDRCEVYLNGERVGSTGLNEFGNPTGATTWASLSLFELDPALLVRGGKNTVYVRAFNDGPYGAGGWYDGPIGIFSKTAYRNQSGAGIGSEESRFVEKTFESSYAASALGESGTVENKYLLYLPKDYEESERYYPTVYLLHQFNSDHTSYQIDNIDQVLDDAIEEGLFDDMIVVVPNSSEESWWTGDWEKMITEELIPLIDSEYRTIQDARYRFTAGCSMGGQGAYGIALTNPDYFSGAVSFFGALSMPPTDAENALKIAQKESAEYLEYYALYFICGNQDSYSFGIPAISLNQILEEKGIEHGFFIENGGHDSGFYVPYFKEAFSYMRNSMYQSDEGLKDVLSGEITVNGTSVNVNLEPKSDIQKYLNVIPASSYTENENPDLTIPIMIQVVQDGKVVHQQNETEIVNAESGAVTWNYDFSKYINGSKEYTIVLKAAMFDQVITLDTYTK